MNKTSVVGLMIFAHLGVLRAQNLIPNPGFENYKQLPCEVTPNLFIQDILHDWFQPLPTSTDYWSSLSFSECYLNPLNINRVPRNGQGMSGIIGALYVDNSFIEYKEYLGVRLKERLIAGSLYLGEFYALNRNTDLSNNNDILISNNMGMAFVDTVILNDNDASPDHLTLDATVNEDRTIPADNQWRKISGCFIADEPSQYALIGNFESIDSTDVFRLTNNHQAAVAYYFIDDVSVRQLPYDVSNLEKDITFCHTEEHIELNASVTGAIGYRWPDGTESNIYYDKKRSSHNTTVEILFNECSYEHTFDINYFPDVELGADTLLCFGETLSLSPDYPSSELIWSDGRTDSVRLISSPGTYVVDVLGFCQVRDSITVNFIDCPGFVPNVFTPNNDEYNPVFHVENIENRTWLLQVFNRWGSKVYESEKYRNDWNGGTLPEGMYYYLLYSSELDKKVKGWVKIIRESE